MTQTSTFQPTLLQKLLGRNYKWWYILKYELKRSTISILNDFLWILSRIATFLLSIFIWSLSENKNSSEIISYLVIGNLFLSSFMPMIIYGISQDISTGRIVNKLLVPSSIVFRYLIETVPLAIKNSSIIIIIIFPTLLLLPGSFTLNNNMYYFPVLLILAYSIRFFVDLITASITFWTSEFYGINDFQIAIIPFLSGSLFPLSILPLGLEFMKFQPLAFTFYHPMQIYLGKYTPLETFYVFLVGLAWCVVLYFLAKMVFKLGLKRNESVGL